MLVNHIGLREGLHALIDDPGDFHTFEDRACNLASDQGVPLVKAAPTQLLKLVMSNNAKRAHRLVDTILDGDYSLSAFGEFVVTWGPRVLRLVALAAFVVFVIAVYRWIAG